MKHARLLDLPRPIAVRFGDRWWRPPGAGYDIRFESHGSSGYHRERWMLLHVDDLPPIPLVRGRDSRQAFRHFGPDYKNQLIAVLAARGIAPPPGWVSYENYPLDQQLSR